MNHKNHSSDNIPKLRFPEFSDSWDVKKLGDLLEFKNGINASKEQYGKGYKFINVLDILNNDFITHDKIIGSVDVSEDIFNKYPVNYGDILFQRSSETREEVGTASVYLDKENSATFGGFVIRGKKIGDYEPFFLSRLLQTDLSRNQITSKSGGSTRYNVGQEILVYVELPFPTLPEQQKIATFLSTIDEKLQALKKKKSLLETYKKGVMQKLFSQELRFKDDDGNEFEDWEVKKFSCYIRLYRGSSPRPINMYITKSESGVNWIKIGDMKSVENFVIEQVSEKITIEGALQSRKVEIGELILANSMSFGKTYQLNISGCIYDGWFVLREYEIHYEKNFLLQLLNSEYLQKQYKTLSAGGVVQNISSEIVYSTNLLKPCISEQTKIANFLTAIDEKITNVDTQIKQTELWKKGLLQQMFI